MSLLQNVIHKVEVAGGIRYVRIILAFLAAALLILSYNLRAAKNMTTQEAMDAAQLGRNLADGNGYTTSFVRPFSLYLVAQRNQEKSGLPETRKLADFSRLKSGHPDITNPPVYPVVLAGLMKVLPFDFKVSQTKAFWSSNGAYWRSQPDFLIAWFNEVLFLIVILLTYFWARRLFDAAMATTSAVVLFGTELLWRFSASGLSTMLLLLIFMGLVWCLTLLESEAWEPRLGTVGLFLLSAAVGVLVGLGGLTRYGFAWLILPALVFVILFTGTRRVALSVTVLGAFLAVMTPWVIRNYNVSGAPFGTATYSVLEGSLFPEFRLERSLNPDIEIYVRPLWLKLLINSRLILQNEFFTFSGGWITALFLVGLLVGFRSPTLRRLRYFLLASLGLLFVVQALGRTQLSEESPGLNSENLLVLLLPLVVVYAISMFYLLVDQIPLSFRQVRLVVVVVLIGLTFLPVLFALLPPKGVPVSYPPYYPPAIQKAAECLRPDELMMSDVPWAVAWYGHRQCVWLTLNALQDPADPAAHENFFAINDFQKPINGVYLTPKTLDQRFQTELFRSGAFSWGNLILNTLLRREVPPGFPLREIAPEYLPEQMFLTDWKRWQKAD
jgi:4-amino-4-deoxy-L-arabinose transferase-like glycosyltransferase